jgi:RNase H-fold protein (predicted Holliday junction resolvase)
MVVLGISVNSRVIGLAIIRKGSLLDFKVQLYKEQWSDKKAIKIIISIHSCLQEHRITNVALATPYVHYTTTETKALISEIKNHCRKKKVAIRTYDPASLHSLCEATKAKKKALMRAMVTHYPELHAYYKKELGNKNRYYHKLFEAVGAATLLSNEHY